MRRNRGEYMKNLKKLTILHSNDMHGDFLAEQIDERLVGGVSLLSGYVNKVRREEKNVIYAIAGDMFRGSVIDSEYKGTSTIGIMNLMGPDVATIGNHEVDYGLAHLLFLEKCADFPIINANLHIKSNGRRMFRPFWIAHIDGMKILFIGIITEEVLAATKNDELIGSFVDIGEAAREVGNICNAYNAIDIDFTVLLTLIDERVERDDVTVFYVPASKLAEENGLKGLANIILVGKLRKELAFCTEETLDKALQKCIPARKADMLGFNRKALEIGKAQ